MPNYSLGLDLGQQRDYSRPRGRRAHPPLHRYARNSRSTPSALEDAYMVRHTQRWRLGTPYTAVIDDVAELMRRPEIDDSLLVFDRTGVGGAVADLVHEGWRDGGACGAASVPAAPRPLPGRHLHGRLRRQRARQRATRRHRRPTRAT